MKYRTLATIFATLMLVSTLLACGKSPDTGDAVTTTVPAVNAGTTLSSAPNEYFRFSSFIPGIASVYSKTQRVFEKSVEKLVDAYEKLP